MNARRLTISLLLALAVSGLFTWLLGRRISVNAAHRAATRMYVGPARSLFAGELLKPQDLEMLAWPTSEPVAGAFDKSDVLVGRVVLYPMVPGQPFTDKVVSAAGAGPGLAARIPDGMRAIALKSDDVVGVAGFLAPGSHLDVLVTYRTDRQPEPTTLTVLQDAEVLAAGHQVQPDPEGKPDTVTVVTLLLSPADAERVVLASTQGTIHFVLRSGSDKAKMEENPISLSQLSPSIPPAAAQPGKQVSHSVRARLKRPVAAPFVVETILLDKRVATTFPQGGAQ